MNKSEEKIKSEVAIFWDDMAQNLPKSIERSALGDEKICRAFMATYPKIRQYLLASQKAEIVKMIEKKMTWYSGDGNQPIREALQDIINNLTAKDE